MKHLVTLCCMLAVCSAHATIYTVSNTPSTIAQFNTVQAAINAAAAGDTVYVHGSPNTYGGFTLTNKQLTIMGPGFTPDKNLGFAAVINGCNITGAGSSNTEIQGVTFNSTISINSARPDNLRFIRNNFVTLSVSINEGGVTYSGYLFEGNIFDNSSADASTSSTYQNFLFQNNYFFENGCCRDGNIAGFFNSVNVLFDHNLWFGTGSGSRNAFSGSCRFLTITNNVFVRRNAAGNNSSSVFNNNITFSAGNNAPWNSNGNINGGGNVEDQDPQMVAQAAVNAGSNNAIADYTIAAGPANNSGSDGKDMGLLYDVTGSLNWANSRNSRLPRIFSMNVANPTVAAGGNVAISVDARVSN